LLNLEEKGIGLKKKRFGEDLTLREMDEKVVELVRFLHVSIEGF
jgi:hypothetical protein